ncbi:hypothetical protein KKG58_03490 [Patescibacteria group bacterium]|nr:hypothetical protein [Patescibacteria group bacterium]
MTLVCPECKNNIELADSTDLSVGSVLECNTCGITLEVGKIDNRKVSLEVIDEGK